jgi:hypothetical protein
MVYTDCSGKHVIYLLTAKEMSRAQKDDAVLKKLHRHDKNSTQLVEVTQLLLC